MVDKTVEAFGRIDYSVNSAGVSLSFLFPCWPHLDTETQPFLEFIYSFNSVNIIIITSASNLAASSPHEQVHVQKPASTWELSPAEFDKISAINTRGTMLCVSAVSRVMVKQEPVSHTSRRWGTRSLGRGSIINLGSVNSFLAAPRSLPYITSKAAVVGLTKAAAFDCRPEGVRVNCVCPSFVDTAMMGKKLDVMTGEKMEYFKKNFGPIGRMAVPEEVAGMILYLCSPAASYVFGQSFLVDAGRTLV